MAPKLEKRIVLSQYLTTVQMAGEVPPQESGLTCSTWMGAIPIPVASPELGTASQPGLC
jgi:hypothetical protein